MPTWDPGQYARFGDERARPFIDLVNRIGASAPQVVVDLGCGNGPATMVLAERWPDARIIGVDNSEAMIEAATAHDVDGRVEWVLGDLATWDPVSVGSPVDVITSNAALPWVDGHRDLLRPLVDALADDGWLAFQVPGNFGAASHRLMRSVGEEHPRWDVIEEALRRPASDDPEDYLAALAGPDTSGHRDSLLVAETDFTVRERFEVRFDDRWFVIRMNRVRHHGRGWFLAGFEVDEERKGVKRTA